MISRSTVTQFSLMIYGSALAQFFWRFHASNMSLFLLSVLCVAREFFEAVYSIHQLSLIFQWRFQGQQSLSFRWWFLVGCDTVFTDDSMRQTWICFCYWFYASLVNSFDAIDSIRQLPLIFQWRFQGLRWRCFRWRFLVVRDAIFTNDSMCQRWICFL